MSKENYMHVQIWVNFKRHEQKWHNRKDNYKKAIRKYLVTI